MNTSGGMMKNKPLLIEIWNFLKVRKAWWLTPIIIMLFLVGVLIVSVVRVFDYVGKANMEDK